MLEAVVEYEDFSGRVFLRRRRQTHAVRSLQMRHVGQVFFENQGFIIATAMVAIASAQDNGPMAVLDEIARHIFNAGRLARATQGQVADANHRHLGPCNSLPASIVEAVSQPDRPAVRQARRPQSQAGQSRPQAASTIYQGPVFVAG